MIRIEATERDPRGRIVRNELVNLADTVEVRVDPESRVWIDTKTEVLDAASQAKALQAQIGIYNKRVIELAKSRQQQEEQLASLASAAGAAHLKAVAAKERCWTVACWCLTAGIVATLLVQWLGGLV